MWLSACPAPADDDATLDDDTAGDDDDSGDDDLPNEWGFSMRLPAPREVDCKGNPLPAEDSDWLCTWNQGGGSGVVYVQATPAGCQDGGLGFIATFEAQGEVWDGASVSPLDLAAYDWGGNHHNDTLDASWGARRFRWNHSSFGFGFRVCQPMDCLQVLDAGGNIVEDGCTCDRTLPEVCRPVEEDGTWQPLEDNFAVCAGDPNCG
jgi:hypothetical protein